jgi:precorrin-6x reductase
MNAMRIAVIAGTSDATDLIRALPDAYACTAFVATPYGKEILNGTGCTVLVGRLDAAGFAAALQGMDAVVDASHPFATVVTQTVRAVCQSLQIPYLRMGRTALHYAYDQIRLAATKEEAAQMLSAQEGNLLMTTGGNTLAFYEQHVRNFSSRAWVRVLDTPETRMRVQHTHAHLVFAVPPFSQQDTEQLIRTHEIALLVSKDSGARGGVQEKIAAAKACQIPVLLIRSPEEETHTIGQLIACLQEIERK